ncbi:MAG: pilin [Candidatus Moraniibacteriota bacterium]
MRRLLLFNLFISGIIFLFVAVAQAAPIVCHGQIRAGVCFPTGTGLSSSPVESLLMNFMWWLLALVGMIAIIAFVISGIQYLVSAGDEGMIETAKRNMTYSIVGVLVALSGWVIIQAINQFLGGCNGISIVGICINF